MRILTIVRCAPLHGFLYDDPTHRRSMSPWTRAAGKHAKQSLKTLQARRCAAPRATFPEFARRIAPMNERCDDAAPNKPQRAVEDARRNTRANAPPPSPHRETIPRERSDTRAFGGFAPSPARRVVGKSHVDIFDQRKSSEKFRNTSTS